MFPFTRDLVGLPLFSTHDVQSGFNIRHFRLDGVVTGITFEDDVAMIVREAHADGPTSGDGLRSRYRSRSSLSCVSVCPSYRSRSGRTCCRRDMTNVIG